MAAALLQAWNATLVNDLTKPSKPSLAVSKPSKPSLEEYLKEGDTNGFKNVGPKGIRFLTDALETESLAERTAALAARLHLHLNRWAAPSLSFEESLERRANATTILCALGPDAAPAAPVVLKILQDPAADLDLKADCAEILGAIGPRSKPAVLSLLAMTTNNNWLSQAAAMALWKIARQTNTLVQVISNRLHIAGRERTCVLPYFQSLGAALAPAAPVIEHALFDENETVRGQAEKLLGTIDPNRLGKVIEASNRDADHLLLSHIKALESKSRAERANALEAIAVFGPAATNAVPSLVLMLEKLERELPANQPPPVNFGEIYERNLCLEAVAEIGPAACPATPALIRLLHPSSDYLLHRDEFADAAVVCRCLGRIGPGAAEAVPMLKQFLSNNMVLRYERYDRHYRYERYDIRRTGPAPAQPGGSRCDGLGAGSNCSRRLRRSGRPTGTPNQSVWRGRNIRRSRAVADGLGDKSALGRIDNDGEVQHGLTTLRPIAL